jgi:flagellar protein FlaE
MNPRDYDIGELRKLAREGGEAANGENDADIGLSAVPTGEGLSAGNSFRAGLSRELLPLQAGADDAEKPYLEGLPEAYVGEHLVFEWLEFLLLHAGYQGATEALSYYESVGWLTEAAESDLQDYLLGMDDAGAAEASDLDIDDHMLSLVYVAKLASMQ